MAAFIETERLDAELAARLSHAAKKSSLAPRDLSAEQAAEEAAKHIIERLTRLEAKKARS